MEEIINSHGSKVCIKMGWKFLSVINEKDKLVFHIEPMIGEPDIIYIPKESTTQYNKAEICEIISSIDWNRELKIHESDVEPICIPVKKSEIEEGTLESTEAGKEFLSLDLFDSDKKVSKEQAHELWCTLEKRFAEAVEGKVAVHANAIIENSVFNKIVIPTLLKNEKAVLNVIRAE